MGSSERKARDVDSTKNRLGHCSIDEIQCRCRLLFLHGNMLQRKCGGLTEIGQQRQNMFLPSVGRGFLILVDCVVVNVSVSSTVFGREL